MFLHYLENGGDRTFISAAHEIKNRGWRDEFDPKLTGIDNREQENRSMISWLRSTEDKREESLLWTTRLSASIYDGPWRVMFSRQPK